MNVINFFKEIRKSGLYNIIYLFTILFFTSCADMSLREYNYIATSMQTSYDTTTPKEQRPLLIRAKSDSAAYLQAYLNFCIAKKYYNKEFEKSGAKAGQPISFRLLTGDSIDISESVTFPNKKALEKRIEKQVALFELENDKQN